MLGWGVITQTCESIFIRLCTWHEWAAGCVISSLKTELSFIIKHSTESKAARAAVQSRIIRTLVRWVSGGLGEQGQWDLTCSALRVAFASS